MFYVYEFSLYGREVGTVHIKPKRGWNQFHIGIKEEFQGKGYSYKMIEYVIEIHKFITISEGRVLNEVIFKIIDRYKNNPNYEVFETEFSEWIISNKTKTKQDILTNILKCKEK